MLDKAWLKQIIVGAVSGGITSALPILQSASEGHSPNWKFAGVAFLVGALGGVRLFLTLPPAK